LKDTSFSLKEKTAVQTHALAFPHQYPSPLLFIYISIVKKTERGEEERNKKKGGRSRIKKKGKEGKVWKMKGMIYQALFLLSPF
jgi:hypothetical protein